MPTTTNNFGLSKPAAGDLVSAFQGTVGTTFDAIDEAIATERTNSPPQLISGSITIDLDTVDVGIYTLNGDAAAITYTGTPPAAGVARTALIVLKNGASTVYTSPTHTNITRWDADDLAPIVQPVLDGIISYFVWQEPDGSFYGLAGTQTSTDPTLHGCVLHGAAQSIPNTTDTKLVFNQADISDTDGYHVANSDDIVIPAGLGGTYAVEAYGYYQNTASGIRALKWILNDGGTPIVEQALPTLGASFFTSLIVGIKYPLAAGDVLNVLCYHDQGGAIDFTPLTVSVTLLGI